MYLIKKYISGKVHPPKKSNVATWQRSNILAYSDKKNKAKRTLLCSTLYPETNSDSASAKSNGCRLVSANIAIKKRINWKDKAKIYRKSFCDQTIFIKFKEPLKTITFIIIIPITTSYAIICAIDLKAPRNAYLELLDQPATIIFKPFSEEIINIYNTPILISAINIQLLKGITNQALKLNNNKTKGPAINNNKEAFCGIGFSLITNFNASAKGWSIPKKPTQFGPFLFCIEPNTFLSKSVRNATTKIN